MDVQQIRAFLAVADELHFGRAAERLHMAQPPLSRLIRQVETDLGVSLFDRSTRGVALSSQGEALLEPARELVMLSQRIREIVARTQGGLIGRVRLGFAGPSVGRIVGDLARAVRKERPGIALELFSAQFSHNGLEKVLDRSLDLVIGRWDYLPAEVDSRVLAREQLLVALPEHHRLADLPRLRPEDLAEEPWIVLPGRGPATLPNRLNLLGASAGFVPRVVQVAPDSSTLLLLIGAEAGIAVTFSGVRDNLPAPGVIFRPLDSITDEAEVRLAWHRGDAAVARQTVIDISERIFPDGVGKIAPDESD
ncbi:MAG: LysR family transcriptional regulator [Actinobacteria bacterium]|nr:LysR family transcriptional regulator [Actinomycetota bacterium]